MRSKDKGMPDDTCPVVREDDTCSHWECTGGVSAGTASIRISEKISVSIGPTACAAVQKTGATRSIMRGVYS